LNSFDGNSLTAVGSGGTILYSNNSGLTWSRVSSGTTADLFGVSFGSRSTAMVFGVNYIVLTFPTYMFPFLIKATS
jgi:photosystem II stability/assembly factor-like uncharacterized protein